ncbi:beta-propeller fold lactonase family protein [Bradyrhizobium sp.]|uniref:YncE family protein n=1 Tax=Bradyrhizobium sp. TaxID=376 RepID=UPI0025B978CD|nr:beta-propeller fold lactonase family protein [Bradyrhizobium sp.]
MKARDQRDRTRMLSVPALCLAAFAMAPTASAQLAVSSNDTKVVNVDGVNRIVENPAPDNVTIIDLGVSPPKIVGQLNAPGSVVGPPQSVAIAPDESIALVVASTRIDPSDPKKTVPDNKLSVIDLKASPPAVIATLELGVSPAGVSFSPDGKLVLVTNRGDGTVSILTVNGKTLTPTGTIQLGDAKSGPSHVAFLSDGKRALVTRDGDHRISVLSVDGAKVEDTKAYMVAGVRPYSMSISSRGDLAVLTNQGGGQGDTDIISLIDLKKNPPRIVEQHSVGQIPEGASFSPDGSHVAVTIQNGSNRPKSHPSYNDHGLVMVYRVEGGKLALAAEAKVGGWGQGVAWSRDGKTLLAQSMLDKALDVLAFDGKSLKVTGQIKVPGGPAGIRTVEK